MQTFAANGSVWQHVKTGNMYKVCCMANLEMDESDVVVYQRLGNPDAKIWVRSWVEFEAKFDEVKK